MRKLLISSLAALTLVAPVAPLTGASASTDTSLRGKTIVGAWKGRLVGDNGAPSSYTAKVVIKKKGRGYVGKVTLPQCSGKWVYKGKSGKWFKFTEKITKDPGAQTCATPVKVKVKRKGAKLRVVWTEPTSGDTGTMLAKHV